MLPKEAIEAYDAKDRQKCEQIVAEKMVDNTSLRWTVTQGTWSLAVPSVADLLDRTKDYTLDGIIDRIRCPCLVMEADGDLFFKGQPKQVFDKLQVSKAFVRFTAEDGAENHCQSGALAYKDEVVFNWIAETLGGEPA
jgi:hypothetical protein